MNILHIDTCALGDHSATRQAGAALVASLSAANPDARLNHRDLAAAPLSHVGGPLLRALSGSWDEQLPMAPALRAELLHSAALVQELVDANVVVLGVGLRHFSLPSTLQVWLDRVLPYSHAAFATRRGHRARMYHQRVVLVLADPGHAPAAAPLLAMAAAQEHYLHAVFQQLGAGHITVQRCGPGATLPLRQVA